jgi:glycosyltransferase involved in cell wall biosynthesis
MNVENPRLRVTALVDTYNHERFIAEAIESVLAQDFPAAEMEILVVDDGSTDSTPDVIRRYGSRVRPIRKENGGQAAALNAGFAEARGEIIAMLDGDDVWLPNKVRRVVEVFDEHPEAGMVLHPYQYWYPDEDRCGDDPSFVPLCGYIPDQPESILRFGGVGTCSTAVRRDVALRVFPVPEGMKVFADSFFICAAIFAAPLVAIKEPLTRYRHHSSNLTARGAADLARLRRSNESFRCAIAETRRWLEANGFLASSPSAALILERMALVEQVQQFALRAPGRAEFFAHLRRYHRLYSRLWSRSYGIFDSLKAFAGLVLGYQGYYAAQRLYRGRLALPQLRESVLPAMRQELRPAGSVGRPETVKLQ